MKQILLFLLALALAAQNDDPRLGEIQAKMKRGEKLSLEEDDYARSAMEHKNQLASAERQKDWAREHPMHESLGLIPLSELGAGKYKGEEGGLYPGGSNTPPAAHEKAGLKLAS